MRLKKGSFPLFRLFGVDVSVHWSWAAVAAIEIYYFSGGHGGRALGLATLIYLTLFAIVLMHEFGHALACKSVGGRAERIVLWPLGGVAFVQPPQRPGAVLWSIAAGPLVNVLLIPATLLLVVLSGLHLDMLRGALNHPGGLQTLPFLVQFAFFVFVMNLTLLIFNLLPIYPLDGGQILQSLLWFVVGRARALMIASGVGMAGGAALILWGLQQQGLWIAVIGGFVIMQAWQGMKIGRIFYAIESAPKRVEAMPPTPVCPTCHVAPPRGLFWMCVCGKPFDLFETRGLCPNCNRQHGAVHCPRCQNVTPLTSWYGISSAGWTQAKPQVVPPVIITSTIVKDAAP
jgi:Zn-dependent protease